MVNVNYEFFIRATAAIVAILELTISTSAPKPPKILQMYRDSLKPGSSRAYGDIEKDAAEICARLKCPHPYLASRSLTGPTEVSKLLCFDELVSISREPR